MKLLSALFILLPLAAGAQAGQGVWDSVFRYAMDSADIASGKSIFEVSKPDVIVEVAKHELSGADLFTVTAVNPNYPASLLESQAEKMCSLIGVPARGLQVGTAQIAGAITGTRATFGTNGVIQRDKGVLRISPIIQAFAGAPEPYTVHGLTILFNGERPGASALRSYSNENVRLEAIALTNPPVVEYRVQLISQDPTALAVPDSSEPLEQKTKPTASTERQGGVDWSVWIALGVAAVAAGVLVYFFTLYVSTKPNR